jgi:RHS repeat-associated protein
VVYRGEFDPHGQALYEWASGGATFLNSHKFTGYERDWATNLNYAKARTYNHNRGRFMQADPLGAGAADATSPQSLNRYSYVGNDPANFVDPTGLRYVLVCNMAWSGGESSQYCFFVDVPEWGWAEPRDPGIGGGGGGQQGGQSEPPVTSNCPRWDQALPILRSFAKEALGTSFERFPNMLSNQEWRIVPKEGLSEKATVEAFKKAGWQPFFNGNPEHFGGSDYEKYHDGAWYHLTIGYGTGTTYQRVTTVTGKTHLASVSTYDSNQPPPWITVHCEARFRPSSYEHFDDYMKRNYPTAWAIANGAWAGFKASLPR